MNQAKYHPGTRTAEQAFATLSGSMANAARQHDTAQGATAVVAVPGKKLDTESFSQRLAADVAMGLDLPAIRAVPNLAEHSAMKRQTTSRLGGYRIDEPLTGAVLIVDDVLFSGETLMGVAQAAALAGAEYCFGLVAAHRV